ncbi:hypothetical protein [Nostoc sp.]
MIRARTLQCLPVSGQNNFNLPAYRRDRLKFKDGNRILLREKLRI